MNTILLLLAIAWAQTPAEFRSLAETCKAHEGCTYSLAKKRTLDGESSFVLSTFKKYEKKSATLDATVLQTYVKEHAKLLGAEKYALGVWLDKGSYYLDVVRLLPKKTTTESEVVACAVKYDQLAVYDLEAKKAIVTSESKAPQGACPIKD